ncbi:MAG: hypothetical protein QG646_3297 [Euryarchaeota archaeon]|nr:hypothetical protein [Euryarchaeota archaeon]
MNRIKPIQASGTDFSILNFKLSILLDYKTDRSKQSHREAIIQL